MMHGNTKLKSPAFVNTVMNIWIPWVREISLSNERVRAHGIFFFTTSSYVLDLPRVLVFLVIFKSEFHENNTEKLIYYLIGQPAISLLQITNRCNCT